MTTPHEPQRPDYTGVSIVNLVASLVAGLGGAPAHAQCQALPASDVERYRNVVLLLIDGLGYEFLRSRAPNIIQAAAPDRLTSVFPSTTASAITSYLTGLTPLEHGLTGWFTYLRELGSVATVLPFRPRHGGPPYSTQGIDPKTIFHWPNVFQQLQADCSIVTPHYLSDSDYTRATAGPARRLPYRDLPGYFAATEKALRTPSERRYVYAYWPELDSLCHRFGTESAEVARHFADLCAQLERFLDACGGDTLVLACADHGHIDTAPQRTIHLESHPELARCLSLPLCGEPRAAFCYVHADTTDRFCDYVRTALGEQCTLSSRAQLLESGLLGRGQAHDRLHHRIGDFVLLMRENWVIRDRLAGEEDVVQIGVHGGTSAEEMFVPLARFDR